MLETMLNGIDESIAKSHRRLEEGWQEWTGTSSYYLRAIVSGVSSGLYLADAIINSHALANIMPIGINAVYTAINMVSIKNTFNPIVCGFLMCLSPLAYTITATRGDFIFPLQLVGSILFSSHILYFNREKLAPPGEGYLHKAWQAVKSALSHPVHAPAPAQTL